MLPSVVLVLRNGISFPVGKLITEANCVLLFLPKLIILEQKRKTTKTDHIVILLAPQNVIVVKSETLLKDFLMLNFLKK